ncbi:MAG: hypothetical protein USCAAHI_00444 [Beijerinckiaceae bacterium]|nr:MAG: hypothetical protein USCAAHI_00444 [Beijerinckiaceae bacterium]
MTTFRLPGPYPQWRSGERVDLGSDGRGSLPARRISRPHPDRNRPRRGRNGRRALGFHNSIASASRGRDGFLRRSRASFATGARINDALELLSADADIGRLRPTAAKLTAAILSGESFADALARHPALFPPMYVELARVGEASARWSIYWRCSAPNGPAPRRCAGASPMPAQPAIGDDPFERQRAHGAIAEGRHLSCDPRRSMRRTCQRGGNPVPSVWDVLRRHDFPRAARRGLRSPHRLAKRGNRGCSSQSSLSASPPRRI